MATIVAGRIVYRREAAASRVIIRAFQYSDFRFSNFQLLVCGGFRGGMHSVLRNFVDATRGRFLMEAIKLIQRASALANRVRLLDRLCDISLRENHGLAKLLPARQVARRSQMKMCNPSRAYWGFSRDRRQTSQLRRRPRTAHRSAYRDARR